MINLGNDDDIPGAPAIRISVVIPLGLVTLSKGIDVMIFHLKLFMWG